MSLTKVKAGNILLTTPSASSNDVTPATTQYVTTALANMVDSAPSTLNTLNELAAALGDDANFSTTVTNSIAAKAPLAGPTFTGTITGPHIISTSNTATQFKNATDTDIQHKLETNAGADFAIHRLIGSDGVDNKFIIGYGPNHGSTPNHMALKNVHASGSIGFNTGASSTERMRIDASGNVGIGETDPDRQLHIKDSTATGGRLKLENTSASYYAGTVMTANSKEFHIGVGGSSTAAGFANSLYFYDGTAGANRMTIASDGKVGIGTTSPGAKLEVSGKDDYGAGDLLRLIFDNSPADTGITFTDIFSTVKSRFTIDSSNTNDLRISSGTKMHFYGGTSNGTGNGHLLIHSTGHVGIVSGKRFYLNNASIASGDTYIDEYSANEVGITTGGSRKLAVSGGNLYVSGSINANHNFSDERLKENIVVIPNALEKVSSLRGITFTRKDDGSVGTGLIAQELEAVLPEAVYEAKMVEELENPDAEAWKSINYGNTVGLLVEAIKELEARIATLEG